MKSNKLLKRIIIIAIVVGILLASVFTAMFFIGKQRDKNSVEVTPVSMIYTQNWNDQIYSSGQATSDFMQELYPDNQKVIKEIFVTEGQEVKIGDPILQYDKTLLEIEMERKSLSLQSIDEDIKTAEKELRKLQNTAPYVPPTPEPPPTPAPTPTPIPPASVTLYSVLDENSVPYEGDGTSANPYKYLCTADCIVTEGFLRKVFAVPVATPVPTAPPVASATPVPTTTPGASATPPASTVPTSTPLPTSAPTNTPAPTPVPDPAFVAVLEVREENSNFGGIIHSFTIDGTDFSWSFSLSDNNYMINDVFDEIISDSAEVFSNQANPKNSGNEILYTAEELKSAIADKKSQIESLRLSRKQAKIDFDKAELAVKNTTVTSTIDGVVRSLISIDDAISTAKPFLVVSGENTFYLHGTINESVLSYINVGDMIEVNSWEAGAYTAQIVSISSYPVENDNYSYGANPNTSTYEFTAVFTETEGIYNYMYFDITINSGSSTEGSGFYIEKMYVRDDDGGSYVMKKGTDNRLAKQYVQTGKSLSGGYYVEIKAGLSMNDSIAFPYGKNIREGMKTRPMGSDEDFEYDENNPNNFEEKPGMFLPDEKDDLLNEPDIILPEEDGEPISEEFDLGDADSPEMPKDDGAPVNNPADFSVDAKTPKLAIGKVVTK